MAILHLEVRHLHIKNSPLYNCPSPQYTEDCQGLYIITRQNQIECVACMQLHNTIDSHPLLPEIAPTAPIYAPYYIQPLYDEYDTLDSMNIFKKITRTPKKEETLIPSFNIPLVLINDQMVPDPNVINPGVFS